MRTFTYFMALSVLSAQALFSEEQPSTSDTNIASARGVALNNLGRIATNTPAFEEWGFNLMLATANEMREKWQLDIPQPLTVTGVWFNLEARTGGFDGGIMTRDHRFHWDFSGNALAQFLDMKYCPRTFRYHDDESARLTKVKSKITAKEAVVIARDYLHRLGLTEKGLELMGPPVVNQYKFEESDGKVYPLPMFNVGWKTKESMSMSENLQTVVTFDISGITKQVAEYFNAAPRRPRIPTPANYYDMLGVKPPRTKRQQLGLDPLERLETNGKL